MYVIELITLYNKEFQIASLSICANVAQCPWIIYYKQEKKEVPTSGKFMFKLRKCFVELSLIWLFYGISKLQFSNAYVIFDKGVFSIYLD